LDGQIKLNINFEGDGQGAVIANGKYCSSESVSPCIVSFNFADWVTIYAWANRETSLFDPRKDWGNDCASANNEEFPSEDHD
jgi:hypothetical protein